MGMILSLTTFAFLLMVQVACMHSEVLLKSGVDGTLKCDITGEAHVVYWTYQDASSKPVLLVRLELLQHQVGQRRVALHAEERYNITDDFSLIIRNVTLADEGRYTCEILELTGSVVSKHSDVSVPEVKMVPTAFLESGKKATLACGYKRTVYAVYWRYESTASAMELLVALDYQVGEKTGPGYEEGRFDINDDYSLVIRNVEAENEGRYTCEVTDFKSAFLLRNHTDVHTIVIAKQPFVRIAQCEDEISADEINAPCVLHATLDDTIIELTCTVLGAKPMVDLTWTSSKSHNMSEYWKQVINGSTFTEKARGEGIFDQTLTVYVDTSFFTSDIEHFTCVAKGLAVDGKTSVTISVYLTQELPDVNTPNITRIAVLSAVASLVITLTLVVILWKAITRWKGSMSRIQKKRSELLEETTQNNPHRKPLYFGVFGDRGAGKSALIDSLIYALIGGNHKEIPEELPGDRETVWRMSIKRPSKLIALCEIRDMEDVDLKKLKELLEPISADEGVMRKGDVIHYPIFVYDIGKYKTDSSAAVTLEQFSEAVKRLISEYPILVLKHVTPSDIPDRERIIYRLSTNTHIPVDNIFFIGTKKVDDSKDEGEILQLLEILLKCVKNITCETATRQTVYRAESSKQARKSWKRLSSSEAMPSSEAQSSWKRWKGVLEQTVPSEQQMEGEELTKLREGEEKV